MLAKSSKLGVLNINSGDLKEGAEYIFNIKVTIPNTSALGETSITVAVEEEPLVIKFSRWSGKIGVEKDLEIEAYVSDPADITNKITVTWTCTQGTATCLNNKGEALFTIFIGNILKIGKSDLKNGSYYLFEAAASTTEKSTSLTLELIIDSSLKGDVQLESLEGIISNRVPIKLLSKIVSNEDSIFLWEFDPKTTSTKTINLNKSFLEIPADYLDYGKTYEIKLTMTSKIDNKSTYSLSFITRSARPTCDSLKSTKSNDLYSLEGYKCVSPTGTTLLYYFGVKSSEGIIDWITPESSLSLASIRVKSNTKFVVMKICDDYECSEIYSNSLPKSIRDLGVLEDFEAEIQNPASTPSAIVYYAPLADSLITYNYILTINEFYFSTAIISSSTLDIYISCLRSLCENQNYVSISVLDYLANFTTSIVNQLTEDILSEQVTQIIEIFEPNMQLMDFTKVSILTNLLGVKLLAASLPGMDPFIYVSDCNIYSERMLSDRVNLLSTIELDKSSIVLNENFQINETYVYDILVVIYNFTEPVFDITFYKSGTYESFSLVLDSEQTEIEIPTNDSIVVEIEGSFDTTLDYHCLNLLDDNTWDTVGCTINSITNTKVSVSISYQSTFKVSKVIYPCGIGRGPVIAMGIIISLFLTLTMFFVYNDYNTEKISKISSILLIYPYSSLFFEQQFYRRAILSLQFLCNYLILYCLIGVLELYYNDPENMSKKPYGDYYESSIYPGAIAWGITQGVVIPFFILNSIYLRTTISFYIQAAIWFILDAASILGILYMTVTYCQVYTFYWIINILIFTGCQIVLEVVYAGLVRLLLPQSDKLGQLSKIRQIHENNPLGTEVDVVRNQPKRPF
ncbi:hypothetical protein SteCoe_26485 [Stentor coeruleus]|uniref:PKD/REJ-like domain-containing protein n=1 Tax=Stentor coeruleus TaxID=5963 RepID=A0A1R2BCS4_9CILI|nr:hypothetical protein SteCoe_26485 [Stentor coeruleus]